MKERPILFSAQMVRSLLNCTKSQTRRVVKHAPWYDAPTNRWFVRGIGQFNTERDAMDVLPLTSPYGYPGDRLWVRETWHTVDGDDIFYRADYTHDPKGDREHGVTWRPSIHMPRAASRILLEIVSVRVERLQEITNDDARAEGPEAARPHRHGTEGLEWEPHPGEIVRDPYAGRHNTGVNDCWICAYRNIWESINGPGSWNANPWVWVVEFRRAA